MIRVILIIAFTFSTTLFAKNSADTILKEAEVKLPKECLFYFKMYLNAKSPKAFAYTFDSKEKVTCRFSSNSKNQIRANEVALNSCKRSKKKRGILNPCKLYHVDNNLSKTQKQLDFEKKYLLNLEKIKKMPLKTTKANKEKEPKKEKKHIIKDKKRVTTYKTLKKEIDALPKECQMFYTLFKKAPKYKAFAISLESPKKFACRYSAGVNDEERAKEVALQSCEKRRKNKTIQKPCQLLEIVQSTKKEKETTKPKQTKPKQTKPKQTKVTKKVTIPTVKKIINKSNKLTQALKKAILDANLPKIKELIKEGADINTVAEDRSRALFVAVAQGDEAYAKKLLQKGAKVFFRKKDGNNLLIAAIMSGKASLLKLMLAQKIDPNLQCEEGNTPLHFALMMFDDKMMKLLYQYGAKDTIKNKKGQSVQSMAKELHIDLKRLKR